MYLGRSDALGGISAGKEADLVLLRENPLVDIRNSTRIEAVIADGKLYDAASLKALLDEAARVGAKGP